MVVALLISLLLGLCGCLAPGGSGPESGAASGPYFLEWDIPDGIDSIPAGTTQRFTIATGPVNKVSGNGFFNEAIQASGGWQVVSHDGATYVAILRKPELHDGVCYAGVIRIDSSGAIEEVNTGMALTSYDTHNFPTICLDTAGYLYVFASTHQGPLFFVRSLEPGSIDAWTEKRAIPNVDWATYPKPFIEPTSNRLYCFYRGDQDWMEAFVCSDDGGRTWSREHITIYDRSPDAHRVYAYYYHYDTVRQRLWTCYSFTHQFVGREAETGVWAIYSDFGDTDDSSLQEPGFNVWRWADGAVCGRTATEDDFSRRKPVGFANDLQWNDHVEREIAYSEVRTDRVFILTGAVLSNGSPVVFYASQEIDDSVVAPHTRPVDVMAARWDDGRWKTSNVSEQVGLQLRVRRSGLGVSVGPDDDIMTLMPVGRESGTTEIAQLASKDGAAWRLERWLTYESRVGVPILTQEHHPDSTASFAWTRGHDLFLYNHADGQFNGIRQVRLLYDDIEIDRLIDYGGLTSSQVEFEVQETISRENNDRYRVELLPHVETDERPTDSDSVLLFDESFEAYAADMPLDSCGTWIVEKGRASIVSNPPVHSNKLMAGRRGVQFIDIGTTASAPLGQSMRDVHLRFGMFVQGATSSYVYGGLSSRTCGVVGVGTNFNGKRPGMFIDGQWVSDTTRTAHTAVPHVIDMYLSKYGVSCYMDGEELCFQQYVPLADSGADHVTLMANSHAYFDAVEVRRDVPNVLRFAPGRVHSNFGYNPDTTYRFDPEDGLILPAAADCRSVMFSLSAGSFIDDTADVWMRASLFRYDEYAEGNVAAQRDVRIAQVTKGDSANWQRVAFHSLEPDRYYVLIKLFAVDGTDHPMSYYGLIDRVDYLAPAGEPSVRLQSVRGRQPAGPRR